MTTTTYEGKITIRNNKLGASGLRYVYVMRQSRRYDTSRTVSSWVIAIHTIY